LVHEDPCSYKHLAALDAASTASGGALLIPVFRHAADRTGSLKSSLVNDDDWAPLLPVLTQPRESSTAYP
jgi:hypothetical protein